MERQIKRERVINRGDAAPDEEITYDKPRQGLPSEDDGDHVEIKSLICSRYRFQLRSSRIAQEASCHAVSRSGSAMIERMAEMRRGLSTSSRISPLRPSRTPSPLHADWMIPNPAAAASCSTRAEPSKRLGNIKQSASTKYLTTSLRGTEPT